MEHFNSVLNRPAQSNDEVIVCLPQVPTNYKPDVPPSEDEVSKAVKQLFIGKTTGYVAISAEFYKTGGPTTLSQLTRLYQSMWSKEQLPQGIGGATIVHMNDWKENCQFCDNH